MATATRLPLEGGDGRQIEFKDGRRRIQRPPRGAFVFVTRVLTRCPFRFARAALRDQDGCLVGNVVVSEQFVARFFPGEEALGKRFRNRTDPGEKTPIRG